MTASELTIMNDYFPTKCPTTKSRTATITADMSHEARYKSLNPILRTVFGVGHDPQFLRGCR
jgi:hypothetical protein